MGLLCLLLAVDCACAAQAGYHALAPRVKLAARQHQITRTSAVEIRSGGQFRQPREHNEAYDQTAGGAALGHWYELMDSNGDMRLSPSEFASALRWKVPQAAVAKLQAYEQNARLLQQDLCMKIPDDVFSVFEDHHNPRNDWRDDKEVELRTAQLATSVGCTTQRKVLTRAIDQINADEMLIKPLWSIKTTPVENGRPTTMLMPILRHLAQLYNALHFPSLRTLLILLLDRGVDINTATANVHNSVPLVFSLCSSFHLDYTLQLAILKSRPKVDPVMASEAHRIGFTLPHFFAERTIAVITKHVIQTGDHMTFANCSFEDAVKALAANPDGLGSEWRGDLYETEFLSLYNISAIYRATAQHFDTQGPEQHLHIDVAAGVGDELFMQLLKDMLEYTNWRFTEVSIRMPRVYFNMLHIMVLNRFPQSLRFFLNACRAKLATLPAMSRLGLKSHLKTALVQQDGTGRSPLHQAALLFGQDSVITQELLAIELELTKSDIRLRTFEDGLQNTVYSYLNQTAKFDSVAGTVLKTGPQAEQLDQLADARARSIAKFKKMEQPPFQPLPNSSNGGGWNVFGYRADLEASPPDRCDIRQFTGMPSLAELKVFLESNEPVILRKAGRQLNLPKHLWSAENFRTRFRNSTALVSKIPYTHQTDSPYRPASSVQTTVESFLSSFSGFTDSKSMPEGASGTREIESPMYLFASDFYLRNPLTLENMTAPFDLIRRITDTSLHQGGVNSDWAGLERNAQMYVGAPGSGAPMHYHQIAVNYLAYGTKRWAMLPPSKSFYSMEPSLSYFKGDSYQRDKADVLECTQHADDLILVPDSWGHVTLNVEACIGVAYEFEYRAWMVRIPEALPSQVFENREQTKYSGWAIDSTDEWNQRWLAAMEQEMQKTKKKI